MFGVASAPGASETLRIKSHFIGHECGCESTLVRQMTVAILYVVMNDDQRKKLTHRSMSCTRRIAVTFTLRVLKTSAVNQLFGTRSQADIV